MACVSVGGYVEDGAINVDLHTVTLGLAGSAMLIDSSSRGVPRERTHSGSRAHTQWLARAHTVAREGQGRVRTAAAISRSGANARATRRMSGTSTSGTT